MRKNVNIYVKRVQARTLKMVSLFSRFITQVNQLNSPRDETEKT